LVGWGYPCGNCRASTNFITKVVKREQVIRDVNQHHHFWGLFVPVEITSHTTAVHLLSGSHSSFASSMCLKCIAILQTNQVEIFSCTVFSFLDYHE
jgi:hypothetical protein